MAGIGVITICVGNTAHAFRSVGTIGTEGGVLTTAGVIGRVAGRAGCVDTLLAIAIAVGATAKAGTAIGRAEGRIARAARVVRRITGRADLVNTLVAITIGVAATTDTAAAVRQADRGITTAARVICRVAGLTGVGHALTTVAVAIGATSNAIPGTVILDTEGSLLIAARVIVAGIAGPAITGHTLARIGVVTVIIDLAADALIAVLAHYTIRCPYIAAIISG